MKNSPVRMSAAVGAMLCALLCLGGAARGATVADLVNQVSQTDYQGYHSTIEAIGLDAGTDFDGDGSVQGYRGRFTTGGSYSDSNSLVFSETNQDAQAYFKSRFLGMGLDPDKVGIQGRFKNVVAELTGHAAANQRKTYIVGAHFDHLGLDGGGPSGDANRDRPGGDDNASGTAAVLEAARVLSQYQFQHTILFIAFNCEERGLWGSTDYVADLDANERSNIIGMIDLDMILRPGSDGQPGTWVIDLDLGVKPSSGSLHTSWASTFRTAAGTYVPGLQVDTTTHVISSDCSDHAPFADANIPAFMAIENTVSELMPSDPNQRTNRYYHTYNDASWRLANDSNSPSGVTYDFPFATDVTRAVVATLAQEAVLVPEPGTMAILGAGVAALLVRRRRK